VGYEVIGALLQGNYGPGLLAGVLLVKSSIWLVALSSGTSGGVLAPLLMMGGALGGLEAYAFPNEGAGFWPLISMAAILAGTMRAPLTGVVFALELTHDGNSLLPLLLAGVTAHGFTVLTMKRSILTEKLARRGHHLTREYGIDPLEILMVRDVMRREWWSLPPDRTVKSVESRPSRLLCLQDGEGRLVGVVPARSLEDASREKRLSELADPSPQVAYPHETVRALVDRMAGGGATRLPVVDSGGCVVGFVSLADVLKAHARNLSEERDRVR
jgi:CBS domain-containing protein